jgi:VanZ family protein
LLGYGLAIEIIQYILPYRSFSLLDLAADAFGLLAYGFQSLCSSACLCSTNDGREVSGGTF